MNVNAVGATPPEARAPSRAAKAAVAACLHCGTPTQGSAADGPYCCTGCRVVHELLTAQHLDRYYALRGERGVPVAENRLERRDYKWLEPIQSKVKEAGGAARVDLDVQGLHCSACIWLTDALFRRHPGALQITVNPTLGRAQMLVTPEFELDSFVRDVERFGYLLGPPLKADRTRASSLVWRMGVCIAIAMNSMIFAIAIYAGLREGPTYELFQRLNLGLSFASLIIGGSVFFRSAWQGLRRGILHLDLPIALGILLAFSGSVASYAAHREGGFFVDTLNVFIALMLVGRWLQERVLEKNRLALLANDGVEGLLARRARGAAVETVRCTELRAGDRVVVSPGDLVPVDGVLATKEGASFSLDWINGESRARTFAEGDTVPAGAFLAGARAVSLLLTTNFDGSPLLDLLRTPLPRESDAAMSLPWWQRLAKWYVTAVLTAAAVGFAIWMLRTHDLARSIEITTAVLIVTCPCAFGIATPLAYDLTQAGLRRAGLFVRSPGFLDRAARVETIVFDKTGTLTSGTLSVKNESVLLALDDRARSALFTLVAHSSHPKSIAVQRALGEAREPLDTSAEVLEEPGRGLTFFRGADEYRLGAPNWVAPGAFARGDVAFGVNGRLLADIVTEESLRPDAAREVRSLRDAGYDVWLLSGDESARAMQTARACGIREDHAVGGRSADAKAAWVAAHDRKNLLMIGDGINDSLVVAQAFCSGTPAIDRPFMAARSDFYFVTPGLRPIRLAMRAAAALGDVRRRNLITAVAYNVLAIGLSYAGLMSPLVCAVFMPASSLTTILATTFSLSSRSPLWRS